MAPVRQLLKLISKVIEMVNFLVPLRILSVIEWLKSLLIENKIGILYLIILSDSLNAQKVEWAKNIECSHIGRAHSIKIDQSDNLIIAGTFRDTMNFDPGGTNFSHIYPRSVFLSKYDANGNFTWAKALQMNPHTTNYVDVAVDGDDNIVITGSHHHDIDVSGNGSGFVFSNGDEDAFVSKFDKSGNHLWGFSFGSKDHDVIPKVAVASGGSVYITGEFSDTVDFDPDTSFFFLNTFYNKRSSFLIKYSAAGNFQWGFTFKDTGWVFGRMVEIDKNQDIHVSGNFAYSLNFDPNGTYILNAGAFQGNFIATYDSNGVFKRVFQIGGQTTDMSFDDSLNLYVTGRYGTVSDFDPGPSSALLYPTAQFNGFVAKYDRNGNFLWVKDLGLIIPSSVVYKDTSSLIITGSFTGTVNLNPGSSQFQFTSTFLPDALIFKLNSNGVHRWSRAIGSTGNDRAVSVGTNSQKETFVLGEYQFSPDFDPGCDTLSLASCQHINPFFLKIVDCSELYYVSDTVSACEGPPYIFPDGDSSYVSTIHASCLSTFDGCDSIIVTDLTVNPVYSFNQSATFCKGDVFVFPDGSTSSSPTVHISHLYSQNLCDSIIETTLFMDSVSADVIPVNNYYQATLFNATYQWLRCNGSGYSVITGEVNQDFHPTENGSYAVVVNLNDCSDTSNCFEVGYIGIKDYQSAFEVKIYPNPTSKYLNIDAVLENYEILIYNSVGQEILNTLGTGHTRIDVSNFKTGLYFVRIMLNGKLISTHTFERIVN